MTLTLNTKHHPWRRTARGRRWAGIAFALMAGSVAATAVALFFYGVGIGLWDVTQNIEGADVERPLGRTVMPQFHAAFSGGAFLGAVIGAGLSTLGVGLPEHLLVIAVIVVVLTLTAPHYFLPAQPASVPDPAAADTVTRPGKAPTAWKDGRTLLIGIVVLGATLTEGAGNDWIAKAAVDGLGAMESTGALLFALFVAAMTLMRFLGDLTGIHLALLAIGAPILLALWLARAAEPLASEAAVR
ncbi:hypothetical protein ASG92_03080 [Arthrobacter sp. Soil736]|nr:hypothetical protein ASG92_03080 [Arthrobacter sp. Soil736]